MFVLLTRYITVFVSLSFLSMIMDRMRRKIMWLMKWRVGSRKEVNVIAGKMKMKWGRRGGGR
jgi:hypothetical protein